MRRTNGGGPQAETNEEDRGVKTHPATTAVGFKRPRSSYSRDEERLSSPPYQTRSRSRVLLRGSAAGSPQPDKPNSFCGGQQNESPQEIWTPQTSELNDSGFAMDDAEDDDSATQELGRKDLNISSRLQKVHNYFAYFYTLFIFSSLIID